MTGRPARYGDETGEAFVPRTDYFSWFSDTVIFFVLMLS